MQRLVLGGLWVLCMWVPGLVVASERPSFKPKIELEHRFLAPSKLETNAGGFGFQADKISVSNIFSSVSYERWQLNWRDIDQLSFGDQQTPPVKQMHSLGIGLKTMKRLAMDRLWLNTVGASWTYEQQMQDAMSVNFLTMAIQQLQDGWSIVYGVSGGYHPVQTRILPVAGFSYRMHAPLGWSGTLAYPRSYVAYGFDPKWQLSGGMVYNRALAKLAKQSVIAADGFGEVSAWQGDIALKYQPQKHWSLQSSLRYSPWFEFSIYDQDGRHQQTFTMKPTWGAALSASYQF